MPNDRQAACSSRDRTQIAGPTSQAAANSSAVLERITAMYSSSVVAVFLAAASCMTSPSAMTAAAAERISSALRLPTSTIILNAWPSRKSPTSTLASFPHSIRAASRPRRISLWSTTSSCSSVAVCMNSTAAASCWQGVGDLRDHRHLRAGARQNDAVDALHVGGDPIEQWIDRGLTGTCERDDDSHLKFSPQRTREHRNAMVDRQVRLPGRAFCQ